MQDKCLSDDQSNSSFDVGSDIVIEESILNQLRTLLGDDFILLVDAFYSDTDQIITSLTNMLDIDASLDCEIISRLCHSLKSISQNVGALTLSSMATQLEKESREGLVPNFAPKIQELVAMYDQVKNELQRVMVNS